MTDQAFKARQELKQYQLALKKIEHLSEKICTLRTRINATNREPREIDIQYTPDPKAVEQLLVLLADMAMMYEVQKIKAMQLCHELEHKIDLVGGIGSMILERKYIKGMILEQIAYDLGYSLTQIKRLHVHALEKYALMYLQ